MYFQDYAILSEREVTNNRSGIRVYQLHDGKAVNQGIFHAGHPMSYDVIALDEHNQPIASGIRNLPYLGAVFLSVRGWYYQKPRWLPEHGIINFVENFAKRLILV